MDISRNLNLVEAEPLHRDEWDFFNPTISKPPLWQWNDWLNYEYARSCHPIVKAVNELRNRNRKIPGREAGSLPTPTGFPRHAIYLATIIQTSQSNHG